MAQFGRLAPFHEIPAHGTRMRFSAPTSPSSGERSELLGTHTLIAGSRIANMSRHFRFVLGPGPSRCLIVRVNLGPLESDLIDGQECADYQEAPPGDADDEQEDPGNDSPRQLEAIRMRPHPGHRSGPSLAAHRLDAPTPGPNHAPARGCRPARR